MTARRITVRPPISMCTTTPNLRLSFSGPSVHHHDDRHPRPCVRRRPEYCRPPVCRPPDGAQRTLDAPPTLLGLKATRRAARYATCTHSRIVDVADTHCGLVQAPTLPVIKYRVARGLNRPRRGVEMDTAPSVVWGLRVGLRCVLPLRPISTRTTRC